MGLFNIFKSGKTGKRSAEGSVKKSKSPKKTKHQKKAPLSYTALEPFVDSLYGDNGFRATYEGEQTGVVLVLPFSEIGGLTLSKEDKRNISKGTFVTSVNKGDFEVYYDEEQDEQEQLIVLANTDCVDTLSDFVVTENAEFRWAYFTRDGEVIETDYVSTMEELKENRSDLETYFASIFEDDEEIDGTDTDVDTDADTETDVEPEEVEETETTEEVSELDSLPPLQAVETSTVLTTQANGQVIDHEEEVYKVEPVEQEAPATLENFDFNQDTIEEPTFGTETSETTEVDTVDLGDKELEPEEEYSDSSYDEELIINGDAPDGGSVDEDAVNEVVNQVLFRDDLNLTLPVDRFREIYLAGSNDFLLQYYEEDGSWLVNQANLLIHEANEDIRRRIAADADVAHTHYVTLLNKLSVTTAKLFDLNGQNDYAELVEGAKELRLQEENSAYARIQEHLDELEREYEERREAKGNEAKTNAMNTYDNQHRDRHDRRKEEYQRTELKAVETRYKDKVVEIKHNRREAAQTYFDSGVAKLLSKLGERYIELRTAQKGYADDWNDRLIQFLDDNRSEDIARVNTLRHELEIAERKLESDERFARLQHESDAEIQRLKSSFDSQIETMKVNNSVELERVNNHIKALELEKSQLANDRKELENRTSRDYKDLSDRYNDVVQQLSEAKTKAALVETQQLQLNQRDREIEDWKNQVDIVSQANDRNKIAFFSVAVVAVVAALLIGMIAGAQLF